MVEEGLFKGGDIPLAERLRPRNLDEVVGQGHLLSPGKPLREMIEKDSLRSCLFYGPSGTGKTTVARIMAERTSALFVQINAVASSVSELKEIVSRAKSARMAGRRTVLFIDEVYRFNRAQQDFLLPYVEDGTVIMVGATAANPFFYISPPLLSRLVIFEFRPLSERDLKKIAARALQIIKRNYDEPFLQELVRKAGGDARVLLNIIELLDSIVPEKETFSGDVFEKIDGVRLPGRKYDSSGDYHYDAASAFIKAMRGGDPDAALLWMLRMLEGGEDPRFIARRIAILASEDVGNADPMAVMIAASVAYLVDFVGLPEAKIILSQAVAYMASTCKSNASYVAYKKAEELLEKLSMSVPVHLMDTAYRGAQRLGRGKGYVYPHDQGGYYPQLYLDEKDFWTLLREEGFLYLPDSFCVHNSLAREGHVFDSKEKEFADELIRRRKSLLRKFFREKMKKFIRTDFYSSKSEDIRKKLSEILSDADAVLAYYPLEGEPDIVELIERIRSEGKIVFLPVFLGKEPYEEIMKFAPYNGELREGPYHVKVPSSEPVEVDELLKGKGKIYMLIPGLAFDERGFRLGRGAGYYDRFMSRISHTGGEKDNFLKIGVAFEWQVVKKLPVSSHDQPVDLIVTDRRIIG